MEVKKGIEEFDRRYNEADEATKRCLEVVAKDRYGGLEETRELKWIVIVALHPAGGQKRFRGFRQYVEFLILEARSDVGEEVEDEGV